MRTIVSLQKKKKSRKLESIIFCNLTNVSKNAYFICCKPPANHVILHVSFHLDASLGLFMSRAHMCPIGCSICDSLHNCYSFLQPVF